MRIIDNSNFVEPSDNGVLGMADATALLAAAESDDAPDAAAEDAEPEDTAADEPEEGDDEAEDAADEQEASDQEAGDEDAPDDEPASEDGAEDEDDEPESPAIDAPKFWSAEEKAIFAKAPAEVQQLVAAKTAEAEKRVYAAKEDAATARKDASIITDVKSAIDQQLERVESIFKGKWDGVDFAQWAKDDASEAFAAKLEYDAEQVELEKLRTAQSVTAREEHRQFVKAEAEKLAEAVPALTDPVKGKENKAAIFQMLDEEGFTSDDLKWIGAKELKIAWEARQWRLAQARLAAKPPKPEPVKAEKKAPATVKPVAAAPPRKAIAQRRTQEVVGKAMKTGRMDDAVTALMAMERA